MRTFPPPGVVRYVKTEPVLAAAAAQAVLSLLLGLGLSLTAGQAGAVEATASAGLGAAVALGVRPVSVPAFTGLACAVVTLLVAFGVGHVTAGDVSAASAAVAAGLALFRSHVTPLISKRLAGAPVPQVPAYPPPPVG